MAKTASAQVDTDIEFPDIDLHGVLLKITDSGLGDYFVNGLDGQKLQITVQEKPDDESKNIVTVFISFYLNEIEIKDTKTNKLNALGKKNGHIAFWVFKKDAYSKDESTYEIDTKQMALLSLKAYEKTEGQTTASLLYLTPTVEDNDTNINVTLSVPFHDFKIDDNSKIVSLKNGLLVNSAGQTLGEQIIAGLNDPDSFTIKVSEGGASNSLKVDVSFDIYDTQMITEETEQVFSMESWKENKKVFLPFESNNDPTHKKDHKIKIINPNNAGVPDKPRAINFSFLLIDSFLAGTSGKTYGTSGKTYGTSGKTYGTSAAAFSFGKTYGTSATTFSAG